MATAPVHSRRLRPTALAAGLVAAAWLGHLTPAHAATALDRSWLRFRADPAQRLFSELPAPRRTPSPAAARTWRVTHCRDDGHGSLRDAVARAGDRDIIDLTALSCGAITLETGAIPIAVDDLTLQGPGRDRLAIDGNDLDRVFIHPHGGALTLEALTIRHGRKRATGFHVAAGGCIASAGYVTLVDSSVRDCYAGGEGAYGGAIYAYSLVLESSTLSGNLALGTHEITDTAAFGGAAFVYTMQLVDSTVTGNRAVHRDNPPHTSYDIGGGIITVLGGRVSGSTIDSNHSGGRGGGIATFTSIEVANSTFSGNVAATAMGGALFLRWPSTLAASNSTFTANRAGTGGGALWLTAPGSQLDSTIVFGNQAFAGRFADIEGSVALAIGGANNLVGASGPSVTLPAGTLDADPLLVPLRYNGGPTRTHALRAGSPAIDAGRNPANLLDDQRGPPYARVYGAAADIGAFELQPFALPPAPPTTPVPGVGAAGTVTLGLLLGLLGITRLRRPARGGC